MTVDEKVASELNEHLQKSEIYLPQDYLLTIAKWHMDVINDLPVSVPPEAGATDYPAQHANADGWTDWISPTDIDMYGLQCCDCGLKHEMQFRVMRNKAYQKGEHWYADPVPAEEGYFVAFRMRRDDKDKPSPQKSSE